VIRVLVVDDDAAQRASLNRLLDAADDLLVVGSCTDGTEVVTAARSLEPDVVLMDLNMPRMDGVTATAALIAQRLTVRILILSAAVDSNVIPLARRAGASGSLTKAVYPDELLGAIRRLAAGGTAWPSGLDSR